MTETQKNKLRKGLKILKRLLLILLIGAVVAGVVGYDFYNKIFLPNVSLPGEKAELYIASNSNFQDVVDSLDSHNFLDNKDAFVWVAQKKNYPNHVHAGRYILSNGMSNNQLINLLRSGKQTPVNLIFNNIRTKQDLAGRIASQIEADSSEIIALLNDKEHTAQYGFTPKTIITMFIPNTYEMYWNSSAKDFMQRMAKEYKAFWTDQRKAKAKEIGLSQTEVSVLASIVQAEQAVHNDEKPIIAGIYINRLEKGMFLESCPTLIYAIGDFSIQRVLDRHKQVESPYNTYKNPGLPPSAINLPEISSIDAVLNYEKHNYLYMCAKEDFSGRHYFSTNLRQHNLYARRYHRALNNREIK